MITSHKVHVSKGNSLMVMGTFNVLWEGSFKNAKTHCVLRPSHNPLRGDYHRKSQETTEYKADLFENWRRTGLIFLLGKIQKGGGVSTRTEAFFGARYFIQPRGTSLKELKLLTPFSLLWCSVLRDILLEAYLSNFDLFPSLARRRFWLVTQRSSPTNPSPLGEERCVTRQKWVDGRLPIFQDFNFPRILGHCQFLSPWSNSLYLLSFSYW